MPDTVLKSKSEILNTKTGSAELRLLVHDFDFWEPNWNSLPSDILNLRTNELTKYELGLLTAIKLAYLNSKHGRKYVKKRVAKAGGVAVVSLAAIAFVQLTITSPAVNVVKSVAAATMSAILK